MQQTINFTTPNIIFGWGVADRAGEEAKRLGAKRAVLLTGANVQKAGLVQPVLDSLKKAGVESDVYLVTRTTVEPSTQNAEEAAEYVRERGADCVIAVGGGSVLDVAKLAAALQKNPLKVRDYFGKEKVPNRGIPTILVPTTSGTGAEVTKHAIFHDEQANVKKAVASSNILPNSAIVDPALTLSCPRHVTADSGFDAFMHAAEPMLSNAANPITDNLAMTAIRLITRWIGPAYADGSNRDARYYMALGSVTAGLVLNNAGTSLVHALAYPIGGEYHVSHGTSLTCLVLSCFDYITVAVEDKLVMLAEAMGERTEGLPSREAAALALRAIDSLLTRLDLPKTLTAMGITDKSRVDEWAVGAHAEQRLLSRSARVLEVEDIRKIYLNAF
ncbi:MAG TPA: iron-containing alcohol dehydrogenase [Candidatus Limnocylindria bacterium]|nr:iron-containing alcohol dehydrogenase [Candidatus Limnocylindria bacterium]